MHLVAAFAAALAILAALPAPVAASGGTYTYKMCADPETGEGVVSQAGTFPDGVTMRAGHINMTPLQGYQDCTGQMNAGRGMIIKTLGLYSLAQSQGTVFEFRAPDQVRFVDADVYRRSNTAGGFITVFSRASSDWQYATPNWDFCESHNGCGGRGSFDVFGEGNKVSIGQAHTDLQNGFKWQLKCTWFGCTPTTDTGLAVYGANIALADDNAPSGSAGVGGLAADSVLKGTEQMSFSGRDGESGVYRARLIVDGAPQPWFVVDGGSSTCRDVRFNDGDDYEFNRTRPCPTSVNGTAELDTTTLSEGQHNLRLLIEDAGGRTATLMDREVTVDNVDPPRAVAPPVVTGYARDGSTLVASAGAWDDDGAPGDPAVVRRWEACDEDGSGCAPAAGAFGDTLVLDDEHVGMRLRVIEVASNGEGTGQSVSELTDVVTDTPAPTNVAAPSIQGSTRRGNLLVAQDGAWDDHGAGDLELSRQWRRCDGSACSDIAGATKATYALGDADLNRRIVLVETASTTEGDGTATSQPSGRVTREDGTLPSDNDSVDNDGDGQVDEPGEPGAAPSGPDPIPGTGGGGTGGTGTIGGSSAGGSAAGGTGASGASGPGAPGAAGAAGAAGRDGSAAAAASSASRAPDNGAGASRDARLVVGFRDARGTTHTVTFGKGAVVTGRLVDETGRPISGASIDVSETVSVRGASASARPAITTGGDGRFTYVLGRRTSSRLVRFEYSATRSGPAVAQDELELRVRAAVRLSVGLKGTLVRYRGNVLSGPMPANGKLVVIQGRVRGRAWQTFATRRAKRGGAFKGRYRLKLRVPGRKLQFRVRVLAETGFPYLAVTSRAVTRTVR